MAYQKKTTAPAHEKTSDPVEKKTPFVVGNVRSFDGTPVFSLTICNRLTIYGCSVREKDGVPFITFPSYKGKDGKYYHHAFIKLTDEETEAILEQL